MERLNRHTATGTQLAYHIYLQGGKFMVNEFYFWYYGSGGSSYKEFLSREADLTPTRRFSNVLRSLRERNKKRKIR
jgi:hypothetical protein